jgi:hypothetical protein
LISPGGCVRLATSREETAVRAAALRRALGDLGEAVAAARKTGVPCMDEAVGTGGEAARQTYRTMADKEKSVFATVWSRAESVRVRGSTHLAVCRSGRRTVGAE